MGESIRVYVCIRVSARVRSARARSLRRERTPSSAAGADRTLDGVRVRPLVRVGARMCEHALPSLSGMSGCFVPPHCARPAALFRLAFALTWPVVRVRTARACACVWRAGRRVGGDARAPERAHRRWGPDHRESSATSGVARRGFGGAAQWRRCRLQSDRMKQTCV
eukprot:6172978-Pleurochrysis_carterae.AAC.4